MTVIKRFTVKRPRSALRMREKSAAAIPVRTCAARTINPSRSSVLMISQARIEHLPAKIVDHQDAVVGSDLRTGAAIGGQIVEA